ncbi:MAG TPA: hypothetical protein VFN61_00985, partial [Acidimicrobiales bacterium]|nr:hypothetical protein [Acidimicrobiales bacterium]
RISAELVVEGARGTTMVSHEWAEEDKNPSDGATWVQSPGAPRTDLNSLGWQEALVNFRPFLSHSELETLFAEPKGLYDQLNVLLGLGDLEDAAKRLAAARRSAEKVVAGSKGGAEELRALLDACEDERAAPALALLAGRKADLEALARLATQGGEPVAGELATLRQLAFLSIPSAEDVTVTATGLRDAANAAQAASGASVAEAASLLRVVDAALDHYTHFGGEHCPVCLSPGVLGPAWLEQAAARASAIRATTEATVAAEQALAVLFSRARQVAGRPPSVLSQAGPLGLDWTDLAAAWAEWSALPEQTGALGALATAQHLERAHPVLAAAFEEFSHSVASAIAAREDRWAPVAQKITAWCAGAREAARVSATVADLKAAEKWLKEASNELRNEQLRPFAEETLSIWKALRQESNVDLVAVRLAGSANLSHVDFEVEVDGKAASGLGVMSQGEVNCLAISVFLPRATSERSPLNFVVVDDPVQAMDPAKVAGLATMLSAKAKDRQVIVFTHDQRLPDAIRDLHLAARLLQVQRRAGSVVTVHDVSDPALVHIADARDFTSADHTDPVTAALVVPGICRTALEYVCMEITRRRRLGRGERYEDVEAAMGQCRALLPRLALALLDDAAGGGEVYGWLNGHVGSWAADTVRRCNQGAHGKDTNRAPMSDLVRDVQRLIESMRVLKL